MQHRITANSGVFLTSRPTTLFFSRPVSNLSDINWVLYHPTHDRCSVVSSKTTSARPHVKHVPPEKLVWLFFKLKLQEKNSQSTNRAYPSLSPFSAPLTSRFLAGQFRAGHLVTDVEISFDLMNNLIHCLLTRQCPRISRKLSQSCTYQIDRVG